MEGLSKFGGRPMSPSKVISSQKRPLLLLLPLSGQKLGNKSIRY